MMAPAKPQEPLKALWLSGLHRSASAGELWRLFEAKKACPLKVCKLRFSRQGASIFFVRLSAPDFARCNRPDFFPPDASFRRWGGGEPDPGIVIE